MNLTTDKWIPVVWMDGRRDPVSLNDVFAHGSEIHDLSVRPHERIALMRLLICIAQAALDGPKDRADWRTCAEGLPRASLGYLKRWHKAFELFGDGPRFLQADLKRKEGKTSEDDSLVSKLDIDLATGSNPTLFDNGGGSERSFSVSRQILSLLAFQCFSTAGTIGQAMWSGQLTHGRSAPSAPCIDACMVHSMLRGATLLETTQMNLLCMETVKLRYGPDSWGQPIWEQWPRSPSDNSAIQNATRTYLGRLVPMSRAVRLGPDGIDVVIANGLDYTSQEYREPHATYVAAEENPQRKVLGGSLDRAIWRELNSLTVIAKSDNGVGGPLPLSNAQDNAAVDIWAGCVIYNRKNVASLLGSEESVFHVPASMLHDIGQRCYGDGVEYAEDGYRNLRHAITVYRKTLGTQAADIPTATLAYWTRVETGLLTLLAVVANPDVLKVEGWSATPWGRTIREAARSAYEAACGKETPRQLRAYAIGLNELLGKPKKNEGVIS